jgi:hypothetical protein
MIMFNYPNPVYHEVLVALERDRSIQAAERYELERALRELDQKRRSERRARRHHRLGRYRHLVLGRLA